VGGITRIPPPVLPNRRRLIILVFFGMEVDQPAKGCGRPEGEAESTSSILPWWLLICITHLEPLSWIFRQFGHAGDKFIVVDQDTSGLTAFAAAGTLDNN